MANETERKKKGFHPIRWFKELGSELKNGGVRPASGVLLLRRTACPGVILVLRVVLVPGNWRLLPQNEIPFALLRALIDFGIGAGIAEEMIFRGVLFKYFEDRYGRTAAVLIPGIVFALLHIMNRQEPAEMFLTVLYTFVLALLFGLIRSRTGSFWPCAAAHGIWNFSYTGCISMGTAGENSPIMYYEIASGNYLIVPIIVLMLFCAGYVTVCRNR